MKQFDTDDQYNECVLFKIKTLKKNSAKKFLYYYSLNFNEQPPKIVAAAVVATSKSQL